MKSRKKNHRGLKVVHGRISLILRLTLALGLASCAGQPQTSSGSAAQGSVKTAKTEECSVVGAMACKAAALFSSGAAADRPATCFVSRSAAGTRVESCGSDASAAPKIMTKRAGDSFVSVRLGWSDNSNNERGFVIERCDQIDIKEDKGKKTGSCNGAWTLVGTVAANVTSYVDKSALANHTYLYRVKAINDLGGSGYTNEALITAPAK